MKTTEILESNGLRDTHWGKIIAQAGKQGCVFAKANVSEAARWTTCACGRQSPNLPRHMDPETSAYGRPKDKDLSSLGMRFYHNIKGNLPRKAAETLVEIERKAAEIIGADLTEYHKRETTRVIEPDAAWREQS